MKNIWAYLILLVLCLSHFETFASPADLRKLDRELQEKNIRIIYSQKLKVSGELEKVRYAGLDFSILSQHQFLQIYTELKRRDFANDYRRDGCYAKSHLISYELARAGIAHGKALIYGKEVGDIRVPEREAVYQFEFHISPVVMVRGSDGKLSLMVLDFSFFDIPVNLESWSKKIYASSNRSASDKLSNANFEEE